MYGLRWAEGYGLLHRHRAAVWECLDHTDIASTMNQGFRNCHLKHNPPSDGFQQLDIHGFPSTQAGGGPELVAAILVVIPQDAAIIRAGGWATASSKQRRSPLEPARGSSSS